MGMVRLHFVSGSRIYYYTVVFLAQKAFGHTDHLLDVHNYARGQAREDHTSQTHSLKEEEEV